MKNIALFLAMTTACLAADPLPSPRQALRKSIDVALPTLFSWESDPGGALGYRYAFNSLPNDTLLLFANEQHTVTMRKGERAILDFWNTQDLSYIMSALIGPTSEGEGIDLYYQWACLRTGDDARFAYDAEKGLFGMFAQTYGGRGYVKFCFDQYGFDLKKKQATRIEDIRTKTEIKKGFLQDVMSVADLTKEHPDRSIPFLREPYKRLNGRYITPDCHPISDSASLRTNPFYADFASRSRHTVVSPAGIDWNTLSWKGREGAKPEEERMIHPEDIPSLNHAKKMRVAAAEDNPDLLFVFPKRFDELYRLEQRGDVENFEDCPIYLYSRSAHCLYPVPPDWPMAYPMDARKGRSDMGRIPLSIYWHCGGSMGPFWEPPYVYQEDTGRVRCLVPPVDFLGHETEEWNHAEHCNGLYDEPIYITVAKGETAAYTSEKLSVWNRLPGEAGAAYWIAANATLCTLYRVNEQEGRAIPVQTWGIDGFPFWLNEKRLLFLPQSAHSWQILRIETEPLSAVSVAQLYMDGIGGFAVVLPNGHYAGTPGCESLLRFHRTGGADVRALAPWRNRPEEVLAALAAPDEEQNVAAAATHRWLRTMGLNPDAKNAIGDEPGAFPRVKIPQLPPYTAQGTVCAFSVELSATASAPAYAEILADGVKVAETKTVAAGKKQQIPVQVPLIRGVNHVEVRPVQMNGSARMEGASASFRTYCSQGEESELYVVALGVSAYEEESLRLQYAAKDAEDIAATMAACGVPEPRVLVLTDAEVQRETVLKRVSAFLGQSKPADRVVCYVAGHGLLDEQLNYYYAPVDTVPERLAETAIPMEKLTDCLQTAPARKRLLMLDTCHAGVLGEEGTEKMALAMGKLPEGVRAVPHRGMKVRTEGKKLNALQKKRYIEEFFSMGKEVQGVNILTASAGAEFAYETEETQNGLFTAAVIETLRGGNAADADKDGEISVPELAEGVIRQVQAHTNGGQHPALMASEWAHEIGLSRHMGYFVKQGDWESVRRMAAEGYRLTDCPNHPTSWLGVAMVQDAPFDIWECLLQSGADVNHPHTEDIENGAIWWGTETLPLEHFLKSDCHFSELSYPFEDCVSLFLRYGARIPSNSVIAWPEHLSDTLFLALLARMEEVDNGAIAWAADKPEVLRAIVQRYGMVLNQESKSASSSLDLLLLSSESVDERGVLHLLAAGADVNARTSQGKTPLLLCAERGGSLSEENSLRSRKEIQEERDWLLARMNLLLKHGADAEAKDDLEQGITDYWPELKISASSRSQPK